MSTVFENYNILICAESELPELQSFINNSWKSNHILAVNKKMMNWQHYDRENKIYNFVIARHNESNEIHGILGFIPNTHFDISLPYCDIWLAIWKVRDDVRIPGLGLSLIFYLINVKNPRSVSAIGLSSEVIPIYKYLGFKTGILNHYYILNKEKQHFNLIGDLCGEFHNKQVINQEKELVRYDKESFLQLNSSPTPFKLDQKIPVKSLIYLYNRYLVHPVYDYHIYGVIKKRNILGFLVLRLESYESNNALRIVDYLSCEDGLTGIHKEIQRLLSFYNAEYVDFYNFGLDAKLLAASGFIKKKPDTLIVPNFFEPFEKKNITINFAYKCDGKSHFSVCKGDSDQDRPSLVCAGIRTQ